MFAINMMYILQTWSGLLSIELCSREYSERWQHHLLQKLAERIKQV